MKRLSTKGIILRRVEFGEADRIITFLTSDFGKIHAIAKGVRKQKSKLAGGIELFSVSEIHFIKGKSEIATLVSTRLRKHFGNIVSDLKRTELGYNFLKVIDKTTEDSTGQEYFDVLDQSLEGLGDIKIPIIISDLSFCMQVLRVSGQIPQFGVDTHGNKLPEERNFNFDNESVNFVPTLDGQFNKNHIKMLKLLAHNPPQAIKVIMDAENYCKELEPVVRSLFRQYVAGAY